MAITSSAKKAIKRSSFLRERNLVFKLAMKKSIKAVKKSVENKMKAKDIESLYKEAVSAIDKATRKNIIHK